MQLGAIGTGYTLPIVATEDAIYLGSDLPFNHRYFEIETANASGSFVSVDYYCNGWQAAVDVLDGTDVNGATFNRSGVIQWTPNKSYGWEMRDTNSPGITITELQALSIYDLYWMRLKFSGNFSATTKLKYIGHKFATEDDIAVFYPDLVKSEVLEQFEAGKTKWTEQLVAASEIVVRDLKSRGLIKSGNQILDYAIFTEATVHACAEIIFNSFGANYRQAKTDAHAEFKRALSISVMNLDSNADGRLDTAERVQSTGWLCR
jgi:hypothetical protein